MPPVRRRTAADPGSAADPITPSPRRAAARRRREEKRSWLAPLVGFAVVFGLLMVVEPRLRREGDEPPLWDLPGLASEAVAAAMRILAVGGSSRSSTVPEEAGTDTAAP